MLLLLAAMAVGTPLDDYIAKPDASYTYSVVNTIDNPLGKVYVIDMKSQTWRTEKEVNRTLWQHWLTHHRPERRHLGHGPALDQRRQQWGQAALRARRCMLVQIALQSKTVVADLKHGAQPAAGLRRRSGQSAQ